MSQQAWVPLEITSKGLQTWGVGRRGARTEAHSCLPHYFLECSIWKVFIKPFCVYCTSYKTDCTASGTDKTFTRTQTRSVLSGPSPVLTPPDARCGFHTPMAPVPAGGLRGCAAPSALCGSEAAGDRAGAGPEGLGHGSVGGLWTSDCWWRPGGQPECQEGSLGRVPLRAGRPRLVLMSERCPGQLVAAHHLLHMGVQWGERETNSGHP